MFQLSTSAKHKQSPFLQYQVQPYRIDLAIQHEDRLTLRLPRETSQHHTLQDNLKGTNGSDQAAPFPFGHHMTDKKDAQLHLYDALRLLQRDRIYLQYTGVLAFKIRKLFGRIELKKITYPHHWKSINPTCKDLSSAPFLKNTFACLGSP